MTLGDLSLFPGSAALDWFLLADIYVTILGNCVCLQLGSI